MAKILVFLDTDVIISALLSKTGASHQVIENPHIKRAISEYVEMEAVEVSRKLKIHKNKVNTLLRKIKSINLGLTKKALLLKYKKFTLDEEDCHVVAGTWKTKAKFLLTYNTKHYKIDKINEEFRIKVLKPGEFLQYLRTLEVN